MGFDNFILTRRRKAKLKRYTIVALFATLSILTVMKLVIERENNKSRASYALDYTDIEAFAEMENSVLFSEKLPRGPSLVVSNQSDTGNEHGIKAPGVKKDRESIEMAPRGFKNILNQSRTGVNLGKLSGTGYINKTNEENEILVKGQKADTPSRNIPNVSVHLESDQPMAASLMAQGGMIPLINQSEFSMRVNARKSPWIPHIIHQTWDTYDVPETFIPWIKSVVEKHPSWTYLFWTQDDVQCYFKTKHPDFLELYNSYWATIFKTDVMRYFLMYDYGGFYLDLDMECLKPLDLWTHYAPCLLSHETYEHVYLVQEKKLGTPNVMTTVLATRPFHPYFKLLQDNLAKYHYIYKADVLRATGPYFMQEILTFYEEKRNNTNIENDVTILNPAYWLPTFDPVLKPKIEYRCSNRLRYLKKFAKELCSLQSKTSFENDPPDFAFLNHHWVHTNLKPATFKTSNLVDIRTVLPNLVSVKKQLGLNCDA